MNRIVMQPLLLAGLLLVAACSSTYRAPVNDVEGGPRHLYDGRVHRVNAGETLYAIAWIYDLDYRLLAQVNDIPAPYTIRTGQLITVDTRGHTLRPAPTPSVARAPAPAPSPPSNAPARQPSGPAPSPSRPRSETAVPAPSSGQGDIRDWQWPAQGRVLAAYTPGDNGNRGMDIDGERGDPVRAAATGEVVYAGRGLLRYGEMIILKHNDRFLSAYAHNDRLLVEEGDRVNRGERIAEMGSTGIDRVMLHFEIRENGRPVNPIDFLPAK